MGLRACRCRGPFAEGLDIRVYLRVVVDAFSSRRLHGLEEVWMRGWVGVCV